ncbi:MAG: beta and beta-prime subunits of DNA dependent RNA-polymerase [Sylvanvirus sp.]|uniref:DNA-directed RNA polymerase subunit n=1 Tax=Sylvanvirus sp. TaxID=2487774 RepID=A0A3G5AH82_9VIRU|nr:MAG: beta and beta-prime subunits of DNA dependent RNA-polymerase [Sylvanvirus sp.]
MLGFLQQKQAYARRRKLEEEQTEGSSASTKIYSSATLSTAHQDTRLKLYTDSKAPIRVAPLFPRSSAPAGEVYQVSIHILSDAEKLKSSVCLVDNIRAFDKNEPHPNGLYDLRMGPCDLKHLCATCGDNLHECNKHNGHMLLWRYKYMVCYLSTIYKLLNTECHECHQIRIPPSHPVFKRAMATTNPYERLNKLFNYCRKVDYCGNVDPHKMQTPSSSTSSPISSAHQVLEFLKYLKDRREHPDKVPYRGCGALQRVYVQNKKEPLNIRCFDRIPPVKTKRPTSKASAQKASKARTKSKKGRKRKNDEDEDEMDDDMDTDDMGDGDIDADGDMSMDLMDGNDGGHEAELEGDIEDVEDADHLDDVVDGEDPENVDADNADDPDDPVDEGGRDIEDPDVAMDTEELPLENPDIEGIDNGLQEEDELGQEDPGDIEEVGTGEEDDDEEEEDDGASTSSETDPEEESDVEHQQEMGALLKTYTDQCERSVNDATSDSIDQDSHEEDPGHLASMEKTKPSHHLDSLGPVTESFLAIPFKDLREWFLRQSQRGPIHMVPFCCMATHRKRKVGPAAKATLPPFDENSEYMFTPNEAYGILRDISPHDYYVLGFGGESIPSSLCYRVMIISPAAVQMRAGGAVMQSQKHHGDSDIIKNLRRIIMVSRDVKHHHTMVLNAVKNKDKNFDDLLRKLYQVEELLHLLVGAYVHRDQSGIAHSSVGRNKVPSKSIIDNFLDKAGRVRGQLGAKRNDGSARAIISPANGFDIDEVGVPKYIAMKTTEMEMVDPYNLIRLQQHVNNGPYTYPGAKKIYHGDGRQSDLHFTKAKDRLLRPGKVVERHQARGDKVIMNRAPSLHRQSMMGHTVVPIPESSLFIPTNVCLPYNADFDGDEMNEHVPRSLKSEVEIRELMATDFQVVGAQDRPLLGGRQNGILQTYAMTDNRRFYTQEDVFDAASQLRYFHATDRAYPLPACWQWSTNSKRFEPVWTGKQLFDLLWPNGVNPFCYRQTGPCSEEALFANQYFCIHAGRYLSGQGRKDQFSTSRGAISQKMYFSCGPELTRQFWSDHSRLIQQRIRPDGCTASNEHLALPDELLATIQTTAEKGLVTITQQCLDMVKTLHTTPCLDSTSVQKPFTIQSCRQLKIEGETLNALDKLTRQLGELDEEYQWTRNIHPFQMMSNSYINLVDSGTKGKDAHWKQTRVCGGQVTVQGARTQLGFGARSFPHMAPHCLLPTFRGYISNSYVRGQTPIEAFCNSQTGGQALAEAHTIISNVGYLQRRMGKALEDLMCQYDATVRGGHKQVTTFVYGEDGIDPSAVHVEYLPWIGWTRARLRHHFEWRDVLQAKNEVDVLDISVREELQGLLKEETDRICHWLDRLIQYRVSFDMVDHMKPIFKSQEEINSMIQHATLPCDVKIPLQFEERLISSKLVRWSKFNLEDRAIFLEGTLQWMMYSAKGQALRTELMNVNNMSEHALDHPATPYIVLKIVQAIHDLIGCILNLPSPRVKLFSALFTCMSTRQICTHHQLSFVQLIWVSHSLIMDYVRALVHPGEMVGPSAAQSASEPTAQMTLSSFHLPGGRGKEEHLTIPRLEEIMRNAEEIAQSIIRAPILESLAHKPHVIELMKKYLRHRMVAFFIHRVQITTVHDSSETTEFQSNEVNRAHSLAHITQRLFKVFHEDQSKYTKPANQPVRVQPVVLSDALYDQIEGTDMKQEDEVADRRTDGLIQECHTKTHQLSVSSIDISNTQIHPTGSNNLSSTYGSLRPSDVYAPYILTFQFKKAEVLEHGLTLLDILNMFCKRVKHSAHLHKWTVSPIPDKQWEIKVHLCCHSKEYLGFWKKTAFKLVKEVTDHDKKFGAAWTPSSVSAAFVDSTPDNEVAHHQRVLKMFESAFLSISVIGDPKISNLSVEKACYWFQDDETEDWKPSERTLLDMKGTDLSTLLTMPGIDVSCLYSNNIHQVEKNLDVHAAMYTTFREIKKVYDHNDGYVNTAPLWLIVMFMGRTGQLSAFTRTGFNEDVLLGFMKKMSFEKILSYILQGAQAGDVDKLLNVISNILIGKIPPIGTELPTIRQVLDATTIPPILFPWIEATWHDNQRTLDRRMMPEMSSNLSREWNYRDCSTFSELSLVLPDYSRWKLADGQVMDLVIPVSSSMNSSTNSAVSTSSSGLDTTKHPNSKKFKKGGLSQTNAFDTSQLNPQELLVHIESRSKEIARLIRFSGYYVPVSYKAIVKQGGTAGPNLKATKTNLSSSNPKSKSSHSHSHSSKPKTTSKKRRAPASTS